MLDHLLTWSEVPMVLDQWFKQTICVSYFTDLSLGSFDNEKDNEIRHYVLAVILGVLWDYYVYNQKIRVDTMC